MFREDYYQQVQENSIHGKPLAHISYLEVIEEDTQMTLSDTIGFTLQEVHPLGMHVLQFTVTV
jgi:hypothetical protein